MDNDWDDGESPNIQGLDDLDADLFGSSSSKFSQKSKITSSDDEPKLRSGTTKKVKFKPSVDFDEDDPLAGLLSDDEGSPPAGKFLPKTKADAPLRERVAKGKTSGKGSDSRDDDILTGLGFDEAPQKKERSFMDQLLDSGDSAKTKSKMSNPKEFSLDEKYKENKDNSAFGSYSPSTGTTVQKNTPGRRSRLDNLDTEIKTPGITDGNIATKKKGSNLDWLGLGDDKSQDLDQSPTNLNDSKTKSSGYDTQNTAINPERQKLASRSRRPKPSASDWLSLEEDDATDQKQAVPDSSLKGSSNPSEKSSSDWMDLKKKFEENTQSDSITKASEEIGIVEKRALRSTEETTLKSAHSSPKAEVNQQPTLQLTTDSVQQVVASEQMKILHSEISSVQVEKEHLAKALQTSQSRHAEELKAIETFYKNQMKSMEELHKEADMRLRAELENRRKELEFRVSDLEMEKNKLISNSQQKIEDKEQQHKLEVQRLKELQSQAIMNLKEEHHDALQRLQRLKEQEIEAISGTHNQTRSIQKVMEELEAKTVQFNQMQQKLESQHQENLEGRRALLETKERQLKSAEERLKRLNEEGEEERVRLQHLILRLEKRLEEQTREFEEEKWRTLQEKGRLDVQTRSLQEEKSQFEHKMELERNKIQQVKELVLQEHKSILVQMAQERQLLAERESQLRRREEEQARLARRHMQDESRVEVDAKVLQQEKAYVDAERQRALDELAKVQRERDALEHERRGLQTEREKLHHLGLKMKKRSEEIEEMCLNSLQAREEGQNALVSAKKLEANIGTRHDKIAEQLQALRARERQTIHEKQLLVEEQERLESKRNSLLCSNCQLALNQPLSLVQNSETQSKTQGKNQVSKTISTMLLDEPSIMIWKLIAEQDKQFLHEESIYLDSLKQNVYSIK